MKVILFQESIEDKFITEMISALQEDIDSLALIREIDLPEIATGFIIWLRVFPRDDFKYPSRAKQIVSLSKKEARLMVSANIEIEELMGKSGVDIYNVFLDRIIETLFVFDKKKVKGVNVEELKKAIESLRA